MFEVEEMKKILRTTDGMLLYLNAHYNDGNKELQVDKCGSI